MTTSAIIESLDASRLVDARLPLLDALAETFRLSDEWGAYHHVRAIAHRLGFHLSRCAGGVRDLSANAPQTDGDDNA